MRSYRIEVYTPAYGPGAPAGTDANMYVTLYGTRASSDELLVGTPGRRGAVVGAQPGIDSLTVQLADLGQITRVHVRHDNAGVAPGWFLDRVVVSDDAGGRWTFPCQRWLARHEDDGAIERVLDAA
ncbi:MAG TPA: PLAT/LH2 domain-containing protein [Acidimicrobiales bacterium]|nr:PLAT/LH2 domain-containing protein [Acidimicrobiales bacterium]